VHEGIDDRKEQFDRAKELIRNAERTYFLGVGIGNVNLERLGVADFVPGKAWATERGLTQAEYNDAVNRYRPRRDFCRHHDCKELIANFVRWD